MALEITHSFVSEKSQSPDPTVVSTNEWNDTHSIEGLDSGIETWLGSATASDLLAALDSVTGTGAAVFATAPTFPTTITIGAAGGNTGEIRLKGTTSGTVTLKVADAAGTYTLTMPTDDGETDYVLATDGSGVLSWVEQTGGGGGGTPTAITVANEAADTTSFIAFFTAASGDLGPKTNANLTFDAATGVLTVGQPIAGSITGNAGTITVANEATDTTCFPLFATAATGDLGPKTNANLTFNSSTGALGFAGGTVAGHLLFNADNTYDIGASGATRPRHIYAANSVRTIQLWIGASLDVNFASSGNGILALVDNAGTSFSRLQFGGTTSSFPALKRSSATLQARLADDSAFAGFTSSTLTLTQGTITDVAQNIDASVTWNDAADTFTAWKLNVTNTASAAASKLIDLQVGGSSMFNATRGGIVHAGAGYYNIAETAGVEFSGTSVRLYAAGGNLLTWTGGGNVTLAADAADTLAQRNSTNAQITRGYRTYTDTSNYERWALQSGAGYFELAAETAGTGTDNIDLRFTPGGNGAVDIRGAQPTFNIRDNGGNIMIQAYGGSPKQISIANGATIGFNQNTSISGANDVAFSRNAAGILNLRGSTSTTPAAFNFYTYAASPPSAPSASMALLYADTSGGKIRLMALFPSGAAQQIAIEP
jgi:hypothetical protein